MHAKTVVVKQRLCILLFACGRCLNDLYWQFRGRKEVDSPRKCWGLASGRPVTTAAASRKCNGLIPLRSPYRSDFPSSSQVFPASRRPVQQCLSSRQLVIMLYLLQCVCCFYIAAMLLLLFYFFLFFKSGLLCPNGRNCVHAKAKYDSHALDFGHLTLMKLGCFCCEKFTVAFADLTGSFLLFVSWLWQPRLLGVDVNSSQKERIALFFFPTCVLMCVK